MRKILFAMLFTTRGLFAQDDPATRKIWLFAYSSTDTMLQRQVKILQADAKGLADRELVVTVVTPASDSSLYFRTMKGRQIFLLQLYGKDGGLKFSAAKPVSTQQLFGIIDAMPMRKEEVQQQRKKGRGK